MPTVNERLAAALEALRPLQADGARVFRSNQLARTTRERLVKHGFLLEVAKGWLASSSPTTAAGDTTPWFASFWEFCRRYCELAFGEAWHLSPDQSLLLFAEHTAVPVQLVVSSPDAANNRLELPFGTSLFALKVKQSPPAAELELRDGLRVFRPAAALVRVTEGFFTRYPVEAEVALRAVRDPSELLSRLLAGGHPTIAGRLAGAYRRLGDAAIADELVAAMRSADHDVRETDPFDADHAVAPARRGTAPPIVARLRALWASMREPVIAAFPAAPGRPAATAAYLEAIDELYELDAYHSLSIEGYQVTPALIERVAAGRWDPAGVAVDRDSANALAARGYWLAFRSARDTVRRVLRTATGVRLVRTAHREWYREMFGPHVAAGVLPARALAGYRDHAVFLRGSRHVPPRWEVLGDAMSEVFDLIEAEPEPAVRAVLGHWLIGYVHPFPDGNGRIARLVMNALLATGGYPWTVIRVEDRAAYLAALERASVDGDLAPFARFVAAQMRPAAPRKRAAKPRRA
jgi:hypothetical protein